MQTAVTVVLAMANALAADEAADTEARIKQFIRQLDAEEFTQRESAVESLIEIGPRSQGALEAALADKQSSAEVRLRARRILEKFELDEVRKSPLELALLIEEARLAHHGKLDPPKLEAMLERLAMIWSEVTGVDHDLPITFKSVKPPAEPVVNSARGVFTKLDTGRISVVHQSIVLAKTAVDISSARDSIIIAGISVTASSPRNCIIIAGHDVKLSSGEGNLVICGGRITASVMRNSVLGAPEGVNLSPSEDIVVLNHADPPKEDIAGAFKHVKSDQISLEMPPLKNELAKLITVTYAVASRPPLALFRRQKGDGEYVARADQPLNFPDGKPIPELEGWQLTYCGSGYVVFKKGEQTSLVRLAATP